MREKNLSGEESLTCARMVQLPLSFQFIVSHSRTGNFGPVFRSRPLRISQSKPCASTLSRANSSSGSSVAESTSLRTRTDT